MRHLLSLMVASLVLTTGATAMAQARDFNISRMRSSFVSEARLETINGLSNQGSGTIHVDPANLSTARGTITVPVSSIETGIALRDEHLHSAEWLDAAGHPNATFEITGVEGASALEANAETRVTLVGRFTLHGVTREVRAQARVRWDGAGRIDARARFRLRLSDFGVSINAAVENKVSNDIQVQIRLRT